MKIWKPIYAHRFYRLKDEAVLKQMVRMVRVYYYGLKGLNDMSTYLTPRKWSTFLWRPSRTVVERTFRLVGIVCFPTNWRHWKRLNFLTLTMKAPLFFEASVTVYQLARHNVSEDFSFRKLLWFRGRTGPNPFSVFSFDMHGNPSLQEVVR